jgi:hypothetical protein
MNRRNTFVGTVNEVTAIEAALPVEHAAAVATPAASKPSPCRRCDYLRGFVRARPTIAAPTLPHFPFSLIEQLEQRCPQLRVCWRYPAVAILAHTANGCCSNAAKVGADFVTLDWLGAHCNANGSVARAHVSHYRYTVTLMINVGAAALPLSLPDGDGVGAASC